MKLLTQSVFILLPTLSNQGYRVLTISRNESPHLIGLPGGEVETNETNLEAAMRILREDTGLGMLTLDPVFTYACNRILCTTFIPSGNIRFTQVQNLESLEGHEVYGKGRLTWRTINEFTQKDPISLYYRRLFRQVGINTG